MPELNNNANSVSIGFVLTDAVKRKISFLGDTHLNYAKLAEAKDLELEAPLPLKKIREEEAKMDEYNKLAREVNEKASA